MTAQQQSGPYSLPPTHSALFRSPRPLLYVLEEAKVSVKALVRRSGSRLLKDRLLQGGSAVPPGGAVAFAASPLRAI